MAIQYESASRQYTNWTSTLGTKQELINQIETVLLAASWTTLSGSGTTNLLMKSATTPDGLAMRLRVKDNAGNCVTLTFENANGTITCTNSTAAGAMLLPAAGDTWRFIANKYQAFIYTLASTSTSRKWCGFGVLALPAHLSGVITEGIWIQGSCTGDTDTTLRISFRNNLTLDNSGNNVCYYATLVNGTKCENTANSSANVGSPYIGQRQMLSNHGSVGYQWHGGSCFLNDAILCFGDSQGAFGYARGFLWDACVVSDQFIADVISTFDGHNWTVMFGVAGGLNNAPRGSLLIATS